MNPRLFFRTKKDLYASHGVFQDIASEDRIKHSPERDYIEFDENLFGEFLAEELQARVGTEEDK